jgi:serine/threonine-protein kinase
MLGRYALCGEIARGGMATVHFGRLIGPIGFSRTVAIKRLHPRLAADADFVTMFVDEALLAARVQHPNVVSTLDVIALDGELALVMEYVQGESLGRLMQAVRARKERIPLRIVGAIMLGLLAGLEAAHSAKNERGQPLGIIHRDMSPQNVLVGADGATRVFDFGVARASGRAQTSRVGMFKGKIAYAAPEQFGEGDIDKRIDLYATSVILWEMLTSRRMFKGETEMQLLMRVHERRVDRPAAYVDDLPEGLDDYVMRGVSSDPNERPSSAKEMSIALERMLPIASAREVADWVHDLAEAALRLRAQQVEMIETSTTPASVPLHMVSQPTAAPLVLSDRSEPSKPLPTSMPEAPRSKRTTIVAALFLALAVISIVVVLLVTRSRAPDAPTSASPEPDPTNAATATKTKATSAPEPVTDPAPTSVATPTTSASATTTVADTNKTPKFPAYFGSAKLKPAITASALASVAPPPSTTTTAPPAPTPSATTPPPPAAPNCSPPFTIDAKGIKHLKPECL